MAPLISLQDADQDLHGRRGRGARAPRRLARHRRRRIRHHRRAVRLRASRRSCTSSAAWIGRRPAGICSRAGTCRSCRVTNSRGCGTTRSASCFRASTCCRGRRRSRTSSCRCSTPARQVPPAERRKRAMAALAAVGLENRMDHHPEPAVRRPAAARGDCARADDRAADPAGRRADRQSRHRGPASR